VAVLVGKELLVAILKHLGVVLVDIVDILILHVDNLSILLKDQLSTLDVAFLVKVRKDEDVIETEVSSSLECVRKKKLFPSDKLNSSQIVHAEGQEVL
jgi:hypothetical protein